MQFAIRYDLRNPPQWRKPFDQHYAHFLDQVAWADAHGFAQVHLSEHHFVPDGYNPSLFTVAAAIAARTKRITIRLGLILLPLKHPVTVAEDAAMVDIISGGRLELMVGAGYVSGEYLGFGVPMNQRGGRMEEGVEIIKRCWEDGPFDYDGKYWKLKGVNVMPKPVQRPRPRIIMGGTNPPSARRAARVADGYAPNNAAAMEIYREEMLRLGKDPGPARPVLPPDARPPANFLCVSRDPDAAWRRIAPHALHETNSYAIWGKERGSSGYMETSDPAVLRSSGGYAVLTPEQTTALGHRMHAAAGDSATLTFHPMMGGMPYDIGDACLRLVAEEVMPHFKQS